MGEEFYIGSRIFNNEIDSSYTHITNAGKQVVRALHFDPWGNVKADTNWTVFATNAPSTLIRSFRFDRGFTGHEHYADLKVINMNGRLYDPVIARFFSPDNFVQVPDFTQSFNRYSYCLNNPLQYVDPSGENWFSSFLLFVNNMLTFPARLLTEGVDMFNDFINGDMSDDGYFHKDYLFNSAPPHEIDYQNFINFDYSYNMYGDEFYEPDMMTDADGTTYRTEYYWAAVGAGGTYNLIFANQNFSGTFGPYRETIRWYTRVVPVESSTDVVNHDKNKTSNVDIGMVTNTIGLLSSIFADDNTSKNGIFLKHISRAAYVTQMTDISADVYKNGLRFEHIYDMTGATIGYFGGYVGAVIGITMDLYKRGAVWVSNYYAELEMELRKINSPMYNY